MSDTTWRLQDETESLAWERSLSLEDEQRAFDEWVADMERDQERENAA